jgi:hypothetical protein
MSAAQLENVILKDSVSQIMGKQMPESLPSSSFQDSRFRIENTAQPVGHCDCLVDDFCADRTRRGDESSF